MRGKFLAAAALALGLAALDLVIAAAVARDLGQWGREAATMRQWFQTLMQPDNPQVSCCGEADAYWADSYAIDGERYIAIITDEREDAPLGRPHIDAGTRVVIPNHKIKFDAGNPTGHGIVFMSPAGIVWCYLPPGGV